MLIAGIAAMVVVAAVVVVVVRPGSQRSSQPQEHTSLPPPCTLITSAALAKYLPGSALAPMRVSRSRGQQQDLCTWTTPDQALDLDLHIFSAANGWLAAEGLFGLDLSVYDRGSTGYGTKVTVNGAQMVTGLGASAVAIFQTWIIPYPGGSTSRDVQLVTWAANAEIEVDVSYYADMPPRPAQLAEAMALARDVLIDLPRS